MTIEVATAPPTAPVAPTPILLNSSNAAAMLGISRSHFLALRSAGKLGPQAVRLGARRLYRVAELADWTAAGCPTAEAWAMMQEADDA